MAEPRSSTAQPQKIYCLKAVTARIKDLLLDATTKRFWVQAHLVSKKGGYGSGHFYGELVESDEKGRPVAKMAAVIWKQNLDVINRKLRAADCPDALAGNKDICALCSILYHEVYGLQLQIHDVDPSFGEAQIDRNRRQILERLKAERLLEKNKATRLPAAVLRIGLITAENSAAFNDFTKTLSASSFAFKVIVASASMQGERLELEVLAAFQNLLRLGVEAICLVRGGGSQVDLAWFDNERIARAIAASPVPVWVGIGHEIDVGVLDFVAHTPFKTPTAVAEALVQRLKELDDRLAIADDRLQDLVDRQIALKARKLESNIQGLLQGTRKHFNQGYSTLQESLLRVKAGFDGQFADRRGRLDQFAVQVQERSVARLGTRLERLTTAQKKLNEAAFASIDRAEQGLDRDAQGLRQGARKHLEFNASQLDLRLSNLRSGVERAANRRDNRLQERTGRLQSAVLHVVKEQARLLETATARIKSAADRGFRTFEDLLEQRRLRFRLVRYEKRLDFADQALGGQRNKLDSLRPEKMLNRGYSITRDSAGRLLRTIAGIEIGLRLSTQLADGLVESVVIQNEEKNDDA